MGYITRAMNYPLKVYSASNQHTKDFLSSSRHNGQSILTAIIYCLFLDLKSAHHFGAEVHVHINGTTESPDRGCSSGKSRNDWC